MDQRPAERVRGIASLGDDKATIRTPEDLQRGSQIGRRIGVGLSDPKRSPREDPVPVRSCNGDQVEAVISGVEAAETPLGLALRGQGFLPEGAEPVWLASIVGEA
jgi:hypothetical protein